MLCQTHAPMLTLVELSLQESLAMVNSWQRFKSQCSGRCPDFIYFFFNVQGHENSAQRLGWDWEKLCIAWESYCTEEWWWQEHASSLPLKSGNSLISYRALIFQKPQGLLPPLNSLSAMVFWGACCQDSRILPARLKHCIAKAHYQLRVLLPGKRQHYLLCACDKAEPWQYNQKHQ